MLVYALGVQGKGLRSLRLDMSQFLILQLFQIFAVRIKQTLRGQPSYHYQERSQLRAASPFPLLFSNPTLLFSLSLSPIIYKHPFPLPSIYNILMSDQQSPNQDAIIIKDKQQQRKYGCPCGKWYLSYPALFTHVKQKHDGKPPGNLIKPKTDKARGRPRLPTSNVQEDQSILNYDCTEELEKVLMGKSINYQTPFEKSFGHETCQDMATEFSTLIVHQGQQRKIINCFLNYLKFFVEKKYESSYWEDHKPTDIIDISNEIVRNLENHKEMFPLEKETLIDLLYVLFRWMYKNKWTDHKLVKRSSEQEVNKENQKGMAS